MDTADQIYDGLHETVGFSCKKSREGLDSRVGFLSDRVFLLSHDFSLPISNFNL